MTDLSTLTGIHILATMKTIFIASALIISQLLILTDLSAQCSQDCTNFNTILGGFAGSVTTGPNNAFFGYRSGNKNTSGFDNAFFGALAGRENTTGQFNAFFGNGAGTNNSTASNNAFFGRHAGEQNTTGANNSFIGSRAGENNTSGPNNAFVGYAAGSKNTTGFDNAFFGALAGLENTTGQFNSFFGNGAGRDNTASENSFFGRHAGERNASGTRNSFFGSTAGKFGTTANDNAFFGYAVGTITTGSANTFFGSSTGVNNTSGSANTFIGRSAGHSNLSGAANTNIGYRSGYLAKGSGNIFLGHGAGPTVGQENVDQRLYIDVISNTATGNDEPLIYGEFDNDFVRINGTFEVTGGLSNPSSAALKQDFLSVDKKEVLVKVSSLSIQEWAYKKDPAIRHLGPTAEDFREAFTLGQDSHSISTIDADGVALLAIQALTEEVDTLKEKNDVLEKLVSDLMERVSLLE